jgi:putative transposase
MDDESNNKSNFHHRRSIRLQGYDYSQPGAYFITICTHNRECLFGEILGSCSVGAGFTPAQTAGFTPAPPMSARMELNEFGVIARDEWLKLPVRYSNITLDTFQIMPNHIHGIIFIKTGDRVGATLAVAPFAVAPLTVGPTPLAVGPHDGIGTGDGIGAGAGGRTGAGVRAGASPAPTKKISIGDIIGSYKSLVSNECLKIFKSQNKYMGKFWQRNYYEHVIRNDTELNGIREYIMNNPLNWDLDENNPSRVGPWNNI